MDPFEKAKLGKSEVKTTRLGFGGGVIGGLYTDVPDAQAISTVRHALAVGINFFDTAPLYGFGKSETRIGRALEGVNRDSFVVATKVGRLLEPEDPANLETRVVEFENAPPLRPVFDFSYDGVMRSFEESLARLQLERIDILHIHDPDNHYVEAIHSAYPALHKLREQGVVRAIGAGMNQAEMLARFARECDFDCFLLAGCYTLIDQTALDDLLPLCSTKGIGIILGGPYNSGILATGAHPGAKFRYKEAQSEVLEHVTRIERVCRSYGVPLKAAALQFPLAHPAVISVIPGCRCEAEVDENVRMLRFPIPAAFWSDLRDQKLLTSAAPLPAANA
jgi:D-threo-aldose 1-dehydrogenase